MCGKAYPDTTVQGLPQYYAIFDGDTATGNGNFLLGPTPDAAYDLELHYYYDPPSIVTSGTSWLGDNAEATLLYGSLIEGVYVHEGRRAIWFSCITKDIHQPLSIWLLWGQVEN